MKPAFVHESSYVDAPSTIGDGTQIWHFCHILAHTTIGTHCKIGQNVVIGPSVTIGNGCKIQNNVSIYPGVTLEDEVFCGPSMVFTNVSTPRSAIVRNSPEHWGRTLVKKGATIGANATIVCGHDVGRYAFVGAGAVVTKDVPDHAIVLGNPARLRGWACVCGVRLQGGETTLACPDCGRTYDKQGDTVSLAGEPVVK
ncbi:MAG: N-acetyltransferase [Candidatus Sericytochromatia bacterium]|nr:N-acetyltransferase [Candidatus Sericytochromatia bacterium]